MLFTAIPAHLLLYHPIEECIGRTDPIVDRDQTFAHHYNVVNAGAHVLKRHRRYTFKANAARSFQPQQLNQFSLI